MSLGRNSSDAGPGCVTGMAGRLLDAELVVPPSAVPRVPVGAGPAVPAAP